MLEFVLIPKLFYSKVMIPEIVWGRKKGMGYNIRWDKSIATDESFRLAFSAAFSRLDQCGLSSYQYRSAWNAYIDDISHGLEFSKHAQTMLNGFMLSSWLSREGMYNLKMGARVEGRPVIQ